MKVIGWVLLFIFIGIDLNLREIAILPKISQGSGSLACFLMLMCLLMAIVSTFK